MQDISPNARIERLVFGPFCLAPAERLLTRDGAPVEIGGRSFDLLVALVEQPGRMLSKRELMKRVWPDVVVEDGSLRFHMASLRRILGDGEGGARFIATQIGVGYAFVAPVQRLSATDHEPEGAVPAVAPDAPRLRAEAPTIGRLPARQRRVIGREHDVRLLTERIAESQLFTIVGAAGVGKTTLAIEVGHALMASYADMVSFVDLGALEDPELIGSAIAGALGITVQAEDPLTVVLGHIRDEQLLLILDNCEHLIDAVATVVERIEDAAPKAGVLATSREPLRVRGEHVHWLKALDYPNDTADLSRAQLLAYPAVELFVERATAGDSALEIDLAAARLIAEMCRRLDGMALPIELTATRVAAHGLQPTAKLLGDRLSLGWTGRRTAQPRQQTLQATLDWSYELLSEPERRVFERLSVFLGPFTLEAALEVVADGGLSADEAVGALDELTAKSLISPDRWGDAGAYRLLEMTRAYAKGKLLERGREEHAAAAQRHAEHVLRSLHSSPTSGRDAHQCEAGHLTHQLGNIRSALEWSFDHDANVGVGVLLAAASAPAFLSLSLLVECRTWCARAMTNLQDEHRGGGVELELQAALGLSLMFTRGNSEAAEKALRRALEVAVDLKDLWSQLRVLGRLHIFHERIGDFGTALSWATMAVQVAEVIGEPEAAAVAASLSGISHHLAGDQTRARRELETSLRLSLPSERGRTIYYGFDHRNRSEIALARTLWLQGYADQARRVAEQTLREAGGLEQPVTHCIALIWTLSIHLWAGDYQKAEANLDAFVRLAEVNAFGPYIAAAGGFRGELAIQQGRADEALSWVEESLARLHAARYELLTTSFAIALTQGLVASRRYDEALDLVGSTIAACERSGELLAMPELLRIKAGILEEVHGPTGGEIESLLLAALDLSRRQGAASWELRIASNLARLRLAGARDEDAASVLKPVRDRFSEGFDTVDLRTADELLRQIAERSMQAPAAASSLA